MSVLLLIGCVACKKEENGLNVVDISSNCLSTKAVPLSMIADTVNIIQLSLPFQYDNIIMFDSGFVIGRENACLLLDRKGDSIRVIAHKGEGPDEYRNCRHLNEHNGLIYITDRNGMTKAYTMDGHLTGTYPSPIGFLDAIGIVNPHSFAGYRVNYRGDERDRMLFYDNDTVYTHLTHQTIYEKPKGHFLFRREGQFIRTAGPMLFKELLNDTIYEVSSADYNLHPAYWLKSDSLQGKDSLRYIFEEPEMEVFRYTPYITVLGEYRSTFWITSIFASNEWQKQVYATHCYDRKSGQTYSLDLKISMDNMGKQSMLLYDTINHTPPATNWDNFFPEQMSADGRHLIAFRGGRKEQQILIIARLKEDPLAELRPTSITYRMKEFLPIIFLLILSAGYWFFRYKKNELTLNRIKEQLSENEQTLDGYRREQKENYPFSTELEQQIYLLEIKNEELRQRLENWKQKAENRREKPRLLISDEGYNLFMKLKAEPTYIHIGEKEYEHLCRVTDKLYRGFATRIRETYPELTKHDIETCCLLKAGLTNQELSIIFSNTPAAITKSKNRIKKRIGLKREVNLDIFLKDF